MKKLVLNALRIYKKYISPCLPMACRYVPTCSEYASEAICIHGLFKGSFLATKRLLKCNPLFKGGFDPVPDKRR